MVREEAPAAAANNVPPSKPPPTYAFAVFRYILKGLEKNCTDDAIKAATPVEGAQE